MERNYKEKFFSGKFTREAPFNAFRSKRMPATNGKVRMDYYFNNTGGNYLTRSISAISNEFPCKITTTANHGLITDDRVYFLDIEGMIELNGKEFIIEKIDNTNFTLNDIDSTNYNAYTANGTVIKLDTEADSKCDKVTLYNNGTGTIYIAESYDNCDSDKAGIVLKAGGSYDENISDLKQLWFNASDTELRIMMKRYKGGE